MKVVYTRWGVKEVPETQAEADELCVPFVPPEPEPCNCLCHQPGMTQQIMHCFPCC